MEGLEKSTQKKYKFPVAAYLVFCKVYGLDPLIYNNKPTLYLQLERFTTWRLKFLDGTGGTAASDISAIQAWLATFGIHSNIKKEHKPIKRIIKAAEKLYPSKQQTTRALADWEIKVLFDQIPPTSLKAIITRAVWDFGFATAMRPSEFLAEKVKGDSKERKQLYVRRERIYVYNPKTGSDRKHFAVVWFFKSKTNHIYRKEFATVPCFCNTDLICPVEEIIRLIKVLKNVQPHSALFVWPNGQYVTHHKAAEILKNTAANAGLDYESISAYSWKKTGITKAIRMGLPDTVVVQLARWRSFHSIRPYINLEPRQLAEM